MIHLRFSRGRTGVSNVGTGPLSNEGTSPSALLQSSCTPISVLSLYARRRWRTAAAGAIDAARLQIPPGSPVMATVRHGYLADGRPVEFTRSVYRGDRYDFVAEMRHA